jgi:hypothetical protein
MHLVTKHVFSKRSSVVRCVIGCMNGSTLSLAIAREPGRIGWVTGRTYTMGETTAYDLRTYNPFRFSSGIARGTVPSALSYIDDCVVQIRVEINLNIELENKVQKGDLYVYWPHSTSIHSGYQGVTSTEAKSHRRPPKGSVLAHELGHAEVFVTMTKPRFENDISSYLSKNSLTSEEQNEVIDLFSQAKRDALGESCKRANANTVLWFQTHDFSVTRRRNGNLKPTVGDEYEFIKR